jgi:hypothetical protein
MEFSGVTKALADRYRGHVADEDVQKHLVTSAMSATRGNKMEISPKLK